MPSVSGYSFLPDERAGFLCRSLVLMPSVSGYSFLRYPFRNPVKSRVSKGVFADNYLTISKST